MMKMLVVSVVVLFLSACAGVPQRSTEATRPPRIVEEDITTEAPTSTNVPQPGAPESAITPPPTPNPQENVLTPETPGQRPPRRIIWRDRPTPERKQR